MNDRDDTVGIRLAKYRRSLRLNGIGAAALLAGVTIYTAVKFGSKIEIVQATLGALFLTLVILCGYFLAKSRGKIEWQADLLDRYLHNENLEPDDPILEACKKTGDSSIASDWPTGETRDRDLAEYLILISALVLMIYIWYPIFQSIFKWSYPILVEYLGQVCQTCD